VADVDDALVAERPDQVALVEVATYEITARRRPRAADETDERPTADITVDGHQVSDDGQKLTIVLRASIRLPFAGPAVAELDVSVYGTFARGLPFTDDLTTRFVQRDAVVILWPHLRASVADLGRLMGLPFPPLPLLNVQLEVPALPQTELAATAAE
jgi:preprotein translocase subunit SecB